MERLSGLDASFLYLEAPNLHMHLAMVMVLDPATVPGGYSFDRMQATIGERTRRNPVFQRRLVEVPFRLGHPVWVDDPDFDLDYHVRRAAVPTPGSLHELAELAAEIAGQQLDRTKPLWEVWVVEGMADDRIAIVVKMHHATVDGVAGTALLSAFFDLEPDPGPARPAPDNLEERRIPSSLELVTEAVLTRAMRPFELATELVRTGYRVAGVGRIRRHLARRGMLGTAALPLTAPRISCNTAVTRHRTVALTQIGLDEVKRIKGATGTTVNDVVLAVGAGALRHYLQEGGELPDRPLVAVVPVAVRPGEASPRGSNQVSSMFVQLPTHLADPLDRLHAVRESTSSAKEEHEVLGADMLRNWAEYASPVLFANAARFYSWMRLADRHRPIANLVVSNVPGPDLPFYLGGAELLAGYPLGPVIDGMGLNITVMSYRRVLHFGIIAGREAMARVWDLADAVPAALAELSAAVVTADRPSQGAGATVIDDAPVQTVTGRPKVAEAGE
jgi:diacylglycerol O-acyltransferase / wax synthase